MHVDLSHTPGLLYALAYWLSSTFYIQLYGSPFSKGKKFGISAGFLALIAGFMTLTDGVSAIGFFPCMGVTVALIFFYIRIATHMPWANAGYYCARAFILGEFSASLAWYLFYFFVTVPGLPLTVWTTILVFAAVHAIILYTMFLLERKYRDGSKLIKITARELFTAAVLAIAVFSVSNISFAFTGTPFSSQFTAEIYIIRTTVDLGGVAMLFAYHVVILEISTEREMEHLQALLHMQYESYRISEESIALVNQKYHDLKHHIQLLRAASAAERTEYPDQMEQQRRGYAECFSFMGYAPIIFISAQTGYNVNKLMQLIRDVDSQNGARVPTGVLNEMLARATARMQPPSDKGRRLKIFYLTQASTRPPTFVAFVNAKHLFHFSYQRYIINQIRENFGLEHTPIRLVVRERGSGEVGAKDV